jgi:hypothetical protein
MDGFGVILSEKIANKDYPDECPHAHYNKNQRTGEIFAKTDWFNQNCVNCPTSASLGYGLDPRMCWFSVRKELCTKCHGS